MQSSQVRRRVFEEDIKEVKRLLHFNGCSIETLFQLTAYGDIFVKTTNLVSLLIGNEKLGPSSDHYKTVVKNNKELDHGNQQLQPNIMVNYAMIFML